MYRILSQTSDPCSLLLQEKYIKQDYKTCSYTDVSYYTESWPVCPVPVDKDNYIEKGNSLFVQEKPKPISLIMPEDIRCDGLLCPIPPTESQLNRPDPELSSTIFQDFLPIVPYMELLFTPTENKSSLEEELMDLFSLEKIIVLLDLFSLYLCYKWSSKNNKDDSSAEREYKDEENEDEDAECRGESTKTVPTECTYFFQNEDQKSRFKKKHFGFNVRKSFCRCPQKTKKNGNERKALSRLFLQFIRQCFQRDM
ncbi:uncharacterized protein LOC105948292 [Xenopus tropicalis]|uniref:Uncharacterized protein LOC105948292 n=1 Tax=Xenopus tropicalis TaxID=8364 RepID=A0A8J1IZD6_XENTR|nr:uncharacterized protein LOC105948292 [Xenopus tropicalis]